MVESKRKTLAGVGVENGNNAMDFALNNAVDSNFCGEDDWIIVKKQRVNILIPRCTTVTSSELSMVPHLEQGQLHVNLSSSLTNTPELLQEQPPKALLAERNDGAVSCTHNIGAQSSPKANPPVDDAEAIKPGKLDLRRMNVEDQVCALTAFPRRSKFSLRPAIQSGLYGVSNLSSSIVNVNNNLRAVNLERNILSAGGLGEWLSSLGLDQFERIFRAKNVSKFHLVNLSMKKLKDMGAHAVGPRRKLIHAIESLCQPYCYKPCKNILHQER